MKYERKVSSACQEATCTSAEVFASLFLDTCFRTYLAPLHWLEYRYQSPFYIVRWSIHVQRQQNPDLEYSKRETGKIRKWEKKVDSMREETLENKLVGPYQRGFEHHHHRGSCVQHLKKSTQESQKFSLNQRQMIHIPPAIPGHLPPTTLAPLGMRFWYEG